MTTNNLPASRIEWGAQVKLLTNDLAVRYLKDALEKSRLPSTGMSLNTCNDIVVVPKGTIDHVLLIIERLGTLCAESSTWHGLQDEEVIGLWESVSSLPQPDICIVALGRAIAQELQKKNGF